MRTVALISGGKDSCFNMLQCLAEGHEIVALAHLLPALGSPDDTGTERDSYMYQSVASEGVTCMAEAIGLPLFTRQIKGSSVNTCQEYTPTESDEVEDLAELLQEVMHSVPKIEAVASGAILSDYQRVRVEHIADRLGLTSLAYLWQRNQNKLLQEMVAVGLDAVIVKVASMGLTPSKHLGQPIRNLVDELQKLEKDCQLNICGEGGEFESFTLDSPQFKQRLVIEKSSVVRHSDDDIYAPVAYLKLEKVSLLPKPKSKTLHTFSAKSLPMLTSDKLNDKLHSKNWEKLYAKLGSQKESNTAKDTPNQDSCCLTMSAEVEAVDVEMTDEQMDANVYSSTLEALGRLVDKLRKSDISPGDAVYVWVLLSDMKLFGAVNRAYAHIFPNQSPPARACIQADLPRGVLLRVACLVPKLQIVNEILEKKVLHVRSLSHWAPANIGPYSQAVCYGNFVYLAGQIGMCPSNLQLPKFDDASTQCEGEALLAARHVHRLLRAMRCPGGWSQLAFVIGYCANTVALIAGRKVLHGLLCSENCVCYTQTLLVLVPALPKAACIEWQCIAEKESCRSIFQISRFSWNGDSAEVLQTIIQQLQQPASSRICFHNSNQLQLGANLTGQNEGLLRIPVQSFDDKKLCAVLLTIL